MSYGQPPGGPYDPNQQPGYGAGGQPPYGAPQQPPPPGYGPPHQPYGNPYQQAPYSPIEAVKYGWRGFARNPVPFLVLTFLLFAVGILVNLASNMVFTGSLLGTGSMETGAGYSVGAQLGSIAASLLVSVISWVLGAALVRGALDVVDTGETSLGAMFTRVRWGQVILGAILVSLITMVGTVLCILPGIAAAFLLMYTTTAVVDGHSATAGIGESFRLTTKQLGETLLLALVLVGLFILGLLACGVGLFIVMPLAYIAMAYTWRVLRGRPVAPVAG